MGVQPALKVAVRRSYGPRQGIFAADKQYLPGRVKPEGLIAGSSLLVGIYQLACVDTVFFVRGPVF
jgi:hypothetical protein